MLNPQNILITGASSGIGRALAIAYSKAGVNLFLCARNQENLQQTKTLCENLKANVYIKILDVCDQLASKKWLDEIEQEYSLDLVIANAGISAGTSQGTESFEQVQEIFNTNLNGVLNIIHPAIEKMLKRKNGQIAVISSLAGFRGLPSSPAYSASKSAVRVYCEGLRGNLQKFGIKVNAVCPGYVRSNMTAVNNFYMPFLMDTDKACDIIIKGLAKNKSRIAFPFALYFVVWLLTLISTKITDPLFAMLPSKSAMKK
ncbi:short-chain dehydrogenase [Alphaproteobacteria bacterium]|nr:short-chain dehydrogenase [Alphaproteobacteria bacterium]